MNKLFLICILALQFCGSTESDFEKDFGTNTLTFTRCDHDGASEIFTSTLEFTDADFKPYTLNFLNFETTWDLERKYPLLSDTYTLEYQDTLLNDLIVFKAASNGDAILIYNGYTCYQN